MKNVIAYILIAIFSVAFAVAGCSKSADETNTSNTENTSVNADSTKTADTDSLK